jgi:hypothetical protein
MEGAVGGLRYGSPSARHGLLSPATDEVVRGVPTCVRPASGVDKCWRGEGKNGNGKPETGNRKQETGNRKPETGNREQETGNGKQETGNREGGEGGGKG